MHDLDELRRLTGQIRQPSLEAIVDTARRRRRRVIAIATAAGATFALLIGGGALLTGTYDRSAPVVDESTPGRMTPERIVTGEASRLVAAAASLDDPDVRLALWEADCAGCGEQDGPRSTKSALALTTDGFASATYVAAPALGVQEHPLPGEPRGPRIESPAKDLFLIVDTMRASEWLVGTDGEVRRVERVTTRLAPTDPRLWFRCHPGETPRAWEGWYPQIDPAHLYPWCALDPDSATAYEWPARWNGSLELPVSGEEPWGIDNLAQPTFAWWEVDGHRYRSFLADHVRDARGAVYNPPTGGPLFFTRFEYEPDMDVLVPREGPDMRVLTRGAPGGDRHSPRLDLMTGTPDGALLAVSTYPETMIWRAQDVVEGDFELVHESASPDPTQLAWVHEPTIVGHRIHVMTPVGVLMSEDDGRTWTEITTWR